MNTLSSRRPHNEYVYTSLPNDDYDVLDVDASFSTNGTTTTQTTMQMSNNRNQYYQDRTDSVHMIEKMMTELSSMFTRLGQAIYEQRSMIEKIDNNLDITLNNVELGHKELIEIQRDVRSNRKLLLKIFFIVIIASVFYILFLS